MRLPYPANFTYEDRLRFQSPLAVALTWHGDAVEVPDDLRPDQVEVMRIALLAYDRAAPTQAELDLAAARERMAADPKQADVHARLLALEQAAGLTSLKLR